MDSNGEVALPIFVNGSGARVTLAEFLRRHVTSHQRVIYIGTDSRNTQLTKFSTVLVAYTPGRGGVILRRNRCERKIESLGERLHKEAFYSVELGLEVMALVPSRVSIEIHLDINSNARHKSCQYLPSVVGLVSSQGFAYRVKPDAWCATCIADRVVKRS